MSARTRQSIRKFRPNMSASELALQEFYPAAAAWLHGPPARTVLGTPSDATHPMSITAAATRNAAVGCIESYVAPMAAGPVPRRSAASDWATPSTVPCSLAAARVDTSPAAAGDMMLLEKARTTVQANRDRLVARNGTTPIEIAIPIMPAIRSARSP